MDKNEVIKKIEDKKIVVITRGIYGDELKKLAGAMVDGGISCFEITYDQTDPNTKETIKENIKMLEDAYGDVLTLGVGTVLTTDQVISAKEAGAKFIVSPNFNESVVKETLNQGLVSMPGCMDTN